MRAIGIMTTTGLGGALAKQNVNAPFKLVGVFDVIIVLLAMVLFLNGRFRD